MRIAIGGIGTETNSFNPFPTDEFDEYFGDQILALHGGSQNNSDGDSVIAGMLEEFRGCDIVPLYCARAMPGGPIPGAAYRAMRDELCSRVKAAHEAQPLDALCLAMHGSMLVQNAAVNQAANQAANRAESPFDDPEADLLFHLHKIAPGLPIHLGMDMHATISDFLLEHASSITLYKTAPHIDMKQAGRHCARIAVQSIAAGQATAVCGVRVPLILSGEVSMTDCEPMQSLIHLLREAEQQEGILSASYALGFPWADSPHLASFALVSCYEKDLSCAKKLCSALAAELWAKRARFAFNMETLQEEQALQWIGKNTQSKPLILSDCGDNATAGASQTCVDFLRKICDSGLDNILFAAIFDAAAYAQICDINDTGKIRLGRFYGTNEAMEIEVNVKGFFQYKKCRLAIVNYRERIDIIVAQQRVPVADLSIFRAAGLNVRRYRAVGIKCGYHGADLEEIAAGNALVLSCGDSDPILERLPYRRVARPIYPLDKNMLWQANTGIVGG